MAIDLGIYQDAHKCVLLLRVSAASLSKMLGKNAKDAGDALNRAATQLESSVSQLQTQLQSFDQQNAAELAMINHQATVITGLDQKLALHEVALSTLQTKVQALEAALTAVTANLPHTSDYGGSLNK